jgi:non-specific serine/threonine protein kinase
MPTRGALPVPLTALVGRLQEVEAVLQLLGDPSVRLVTLTGPGGVGKTRLALQVARILRDSTAFADGVSYVPLAAVRDPAQVVPAIAQALEVGELGERPLSERLMLALAQRELLIVLDNLEQVLACAPQLTELLAACPGLTLLATSREVLHVQGEHELPVSPLALPDKHRLLELTELRDTEAVALFVQRATAALPSFRLTAENAPAVAHICHRLDGLPLAIELAAARVKLLPPHGLLARLDHRLALLTGGARDLPERQQTLRATLTWSYDLLTPVEQCLFRRLAVFPGGCTLDAAEAVVMDGLGLDVLAGLGSLLDKSLLVRVEDPSGVARFRMLETVREFAADQLEASGEAEDMRQRVVAWVVGFMDTVMPDLGEFPNVPPHRSMLAHIEPELDNLRAAVMWGAGHEAMRRVITALGTLFFFCGYAREGIQTLERALAQSRDSPPQVQARLLFAWGWSLIGRRDLERAQACADESLRIARALDDPAYLGEALHLAGHVAQGHGQFDRAEEALAEAIIQFRRSQNPVRLSHAQTILGLVAYRRGDLEGARPHFEAAIATSRAAGSAWGAAVAEMFYARVVRDRGEHAAAVTMWVASTRRLLEYGDRMTASYSLRPLAGLAARYQQPETATILLGAYSALDDAIGVPLSPHGQAAYGRLRAELVQSLPPATFEAGWAAGRALTPEQAIELAATITIAPPESPHATLAIGPASPYGLTARELEVLRHLVEGRSSQEIAAALFVSPRTVRTHVTNIFNKLNVSSRAAAVGVALRQGIV